MVENTVKKQDKLLSGDSKYQNLVILDWTVSSEVDIWIFFIS